MHMFLLIIIIFIVIISFIILKKPDPNVSLISLLMLMFTLIYLNNKCKNKNKNNTMYNKLSAKHDIDLDDYSLNVEVDKVSTDESDLETNNKLSKNMNTSDNKSPQHNIDNIKEITSPDVYAMDTDDEYYNKFGTMQEGEYVGDQFTKYYFGRFGSNKEYTTCYKGPSWELNGCNMYSTMSIDEKAAQQAKMRNQEKRVLDGWTSKNLNYYRKNFADELDIEENLPWWGRDEM